MDVVKLMFLYLFIGWWTVKNASQIPLVAYVVHFKDYVKFLKLVVLMQ